MSAIFHQLAPGVSVIERGWLNCNQIVLRAPTWNVLIDSGYGRGRHAAETVQHVDAALEGGRVHWLLNTHCHSDHMGGNRTLREHYQCRVTIPEGEAKHVVPWTEQSCWAEQMDQYAEEFVFDDTLVAGDTFEAGGMLWRAYAAPGHDMDALMFFARDAGILITGDALWEHGLGFVWPEANARSTSGNSYVDSALECLRVIEKLKPAIVVPGHGAPFNDVANAIAEARQRLAALAKDPVKNARHVTKALFVFALLDRGEMRVADVPRYLESVPIYREMCEQYLHCDRAVLAERMVSELVAVKALVIDAGVIRPTMRA